MGVTGSTDHLLVKMIIGRRFRFITPRVPHFLKWSAASGDGVFRAPFSSAAAAALLSLVLPSAGSVAPGNEQPHAKLRGSFGSPAHPLAGRQSLLAGAGRTWKDTVLRWPPFRKWRGFLRLLPRAGARLLRQHALSKGVDGKLGPSHAYAHQPRLGQIAILGWTGAHAGVASIVPMTNPDEMGMTADQVVKGSRASKAMPRCLPPLSATARSTSTASPRHRQLRAHHRFGKFPLRPLLAGDKSALTKQQKAGLDFFNGKGECAECHSGPNFTTEKFANLGIGMDQVNPDPGAKRSPKSAAISENSKCRLCAILPIAGPTCTTAGSKLSVRFWISTPREGCRILTWTLASHPSIWMSKPSRICWLFSIHSTEKAGRKSSRPRPFRNQRNRRILLHQSTSIQPSAIKAYRNTEVTADLQLTVFSRISVLICRCSPICMGMMLG